MRKSILAGLVALRALDLTQVRRKLQEPAPEGKGWDDKTAEEAEMWYRRFLEVCVRNPEFPVVPNGVIDTFWHQHILDTRAYAQDCDMVFGEFVHHYPYFGLNGDAQQRDDAFVETNKLYHSLFGEDCTTIGSNPTDCDPGGGSSCVNAVASGCGHSGSGTGCGQGGRGGRTREPEKTLVSSSCAVGCHPEVSFGSRTHDVELI
jgi:hypothetical protein